MAVPVILILSLVEGWKNGLWSGVRILLGAYVLIFILGFIYGFFEAMPSFRKTAFFRGFQMGLNDARGEGIVVSPKFVKGLQLGLMFGYFAFLYFRYDLGTDISAAVSWILASLNNNSFVSTEGTIQLMN